jgi:hypothetical protein
MSKTEDDTDLLLNLTREAELFRSEWGEPYADFEAGGVRHTAPLCSAEFEDWLTVKFLRASGRAIRRAPMDTVLATLRANGSLSNTVCPIFLRFGSVGNKRYLDLANSRGEVVEITATGWRLVTDCPLRFRRPKWMGALPTPIAGAQIDLLRYFLGNITDDGFVLVVGWLLSLFHAGIRPMLVFTGPHGSAKSGAARFTRAIVDPRFDPLSSLPETRAEFSRAINNGWIQAWDNISDIKPRVSDLLCQISTGGFDHRSPPGARLCDEGMRPMILNGIVTFVQRPDLADRALFVPLEPAKAGRLIGTEKLNSRFAQCWPKILGALLDATVCGLAAGTRSTSTVGRFVDMEQWVARCEPALCLPVKFQAAYAESRIQSNHSLADADPLCALLADYLAERSEFLGTPTELWKALERHNQSCKLLSRFPGSAAALTARLKRLEPLLNDQGIRLTPDRGGQQGTRSILIKSSSPRRDASSAPSPTIRRPKTAAADQSQLSLGLGDLARC